MSPTIRARTKAVDTRMAFGLSELAPLRFASVTRDRMTQWFKGRSDARAPKTVKNEHALISAVLARAPKERLNDSNPGHGLKLPVGRDPVELVILSRDEFRGLLDAAPAIAPTSMTVFWRALIDFRFVIAPSTELRPSGLPGSHV